MISRVRAGVLVVVIVGCVAGPLLARRQVTVPFKADGVGTLTPGADGGLHVSGGGYSTHLGSYTVSGVQTIQPGMPPTFLGEVTLVGSNGDELYVTVTGFMTSLPPDPAGEGEYEIQGGTGRFQGASGEGDFRAAADGTRFDGFIRF